MDINTYIVLNDLIVTLAQQQMVLIQFLTFITMLILLTVAVCTIIIYVEISKLSKEISQKVKINN